MTGLSLRPYQAEAIEAAMTAPLNGVRRAAEVLPTGSGKTVVIAGVAAEHVAQRDRVAGISGVRSGRRVVVVAHREELVRQNAKTVRRFAPHLRVGIVQADIDQTEADVISASVATLRNTARLSRIRDVGLVVVDEAHHAVAPSYLKVLEHYGCLGDGQENLPTRPWALGLTATMMRADEAALGELWQDVVYTRSIAEMIREGWLVPPRGLRVKVPGLDLSRVRKSGGDYQNGDLGRAIEGSLAPELVAKAYAEHAPGRQGILFAPTVETAKLYADALAAVGISSVAIWGDMEPADRRRALARFEDGAVQVLCNCMILTEGTDLPMAEVCVVGRPTKSKGLLIQMVGRVLRLHPGKDSALILDVSGATEKHSLLGSVDLFGLDGMRIPVEGEEDERAEEELVALGEPGERQWDGELDEAEEPVFLTGPVEVHEVDLFHGSRSMWQRTRGGIWFLHAYSGKARDGGSDRYIIVQRAVRPGCWDVIEMDARTRGRSSWVATEVEDLSFAMAYAEANVTPAEQMTARKDARWRSTPTSQQQRDLAARVGVVGWEFMGKGELSNAIDQVMATRRIDPLVPAYARTGAGGTW